MSWLNVAIVLSVAAMLFPARLFDAAFPLLEFLTQHRAAGAWLAFGCSCFVAALCLRLNHT